ncbi:MAG: NUDIX hydrolase [Cytophagaceae bacterium]|nr:NUDIX hydrolase [Cytophagaceae bacterium]
MWKENLDSISIDCVIFGFDETGLKILLIKRAGEPQKGKWALPGGFVQTNEDLDSSAKRILKELTGLSNIYLDQLYTFGEVDRYPLRRVISIAYYALVKIRDYNLKASANAKEAIWHPIDQAPKLVFDHNKILNNGIEKLRNNVRFHPIGFELLPKKFTLSQLQQLYEAILDKALDKRNFRKKILSMDLLINLNESQQGVAHRAAKLYQFDKNKYKELKARGFNFEI